MRLRALSMFITACVITACPGLAQEAPATFKSTTKLVQVSVIAQDQQGKLVADLAREEFQILDNGAPQEIRLFLDENFVSPAPEARAPNTFTNQLGVGSTASGGYSVILFDSLISGFGKPDENGTSFGAVKVLRMLREIPQGERIAIYAIGSKFQVVREFTTDRESLERRMRTWAPPVDTADPEMTNCGSFTNRDVAADCVRVDMRRRLDSFDQQLKQIADHLAGIPGRKNLIWMANRFPIAGGPAVERLMNAGVAIYPVDEIGAMQALEKDKQIHSAPMRALAAMTGGVAFFDRDDLDVAVREAMDDGRVSYTLGFYQPGGDNKPAMHRLTVRVSRPGVTLRYRTSYRTEPPQPVSASPVADLVQAMNRPMDAAAIAITASATGSGDRLDLTAAVDISSLDLDLNQGVWKGQAEVVARFTTAEGVKVGEVLSETIVFNLTPATYAAMSRSGVPYRKELKIPAKAVELKVLVGNLATGKIGTVTIPLSEVKSP